MSDLAWYCCLQRFKASLPASTSDKPGVGAMMAINPNEALQQVLKAQGPLEGVVGVTEPSPAAAATTVKAEGSTTQTEQQQNAQPKSQSQTQRRRSSSQTGEQQEGDRQQQPQQMNTSGPSLQQQQQPQSEHAGPAATNAPAAPACGVTVVPPAGVPELGVPSWDPMLLLNTPKPTPEAAAAATAAAHQRLMFGGPLMHAGFKTEQQQQQQGSAPRTAATAAETVHIKSEPPAAGLMLADVDGSPDVGTGCRVVSEAVPATEGCVPAAAQAVGGVAPR